MMQTIRHWIYGIRLYIAVGTALVTLEVLWWAHAAYGSTSTATLRIEEIFAWLAVGLVGVALAIGPSYKVFPTLPGKALLSDARRLFGVSAAWFATLHALIAYFGLLKGPHNPLDLPPAYFRSFIAGITALLILLAMAFTSFDAAFKTMGKWWFRLHRLVYMAGFVTILHAFIVGVHATNLGTIIALSVIAALLITLHAQRLWVIRSRNPGSYLLLCVAIITFVIVVAYGLKQHRLNSFIQTQAPGSPLERQ